jgi:hypothetical protein
MSAETPSAALTPEPLDLLLDTLPTAAVFAFVRGDALLERAVFHGFQVRESNLRKASVRARLLMEARRNAPLGEALRALWEELYGELTDTLDAEDFLPSAETLAAHYDPVNPATLHYALLQSPREDVRAWGERLADVQDAYTQAHPLTEAPTLPSEPPVEEFQVATLERQVRALRHERDEAVRARDEYKRRLEALEGVAEGAAGREAKLRHQMETMRKDAEEQLARETRRARKAEERVEALKQEVRTAKAAPPAKLPKTTAPPAPLLPEAAACVAQAARLLQQALATTAQAGSTPIVSEPPPPAPVKKPAPPRLVAPNLGLMPPPRAPRTPRTTVTPALVLAALARNDAETLGLARKAIAKLGTKPAEERAALAAYESAGVPAALLSGSLRPALLDGSNIANMAAARRGKLAYLAQARQSAWEEGYFPVTIIVDASLRLQIDQPDLLMQMVERGEVRMAEAGTSADRLLIEEARSVHGVIITNDRMKDWPEAKGVEKRHAVLRQGAVVLGGFHGSSTLFS